MMEALRKRGLKTPQYTKADCVSDIVNWVRKKKISKAVLKPLSSAGTDNVHICRSEMEIRRAFSEIIGSEDRFGYVNKEVLAEEYLEGIEYVVNTVSRDQIHYLVEIWRCKKRLVKGPAASACIYDLAELLPFHGDDQAKLAEYALRVLDALEIAHGPAHAEIMMTSEGPILIEIGARLMGSINPSAIDECIGTNPVRLMVEAYLNPSLFKRRCETPYSLRKSAYGVCLISNVEGTLEALPLLKEVEQLESFFSIRLNIQVGSRIERTVNFFTSPGGVYLIHHDPKVLEMDYQKLRRLEATGYVLGKTTGAGD
jgi:biotin carboxylase